MAGLTTLAVPPHLSCKPLYRGLQEFFKLIIDTEGTRFIDLRQGRLAAALVSPLEYARAASLSCVLPEIAVSSRTPNDAITLHFRDELHTIATLAVDPSCASEIVLAKIILAEEFDIRPAMVPTIGSLEHMLTRGDAALMVGDSSLGIGTAHLNKIDLVEAWNEMTRTPYVHAVWVVREHGLGAHEVASIQKVGKRAEDAVREIVSEAPPDKKETLGLHLSAFSYLLTDEEEAGIAEFFRYAYFHGVLPDIPDLQYFSQDEEHHDADDAAP